MFLERCGVSASMSLFCLVPTAMLLRLETKQESVKQNDVFETKPFAAGWLEYPVLRSAVASWLVMRFMKAAVSSPQHFSVHVDSPF
jgi:hypothetical protein